MHITGADPGFQVRGGGALKKIEATQQNSHKKKDKRTNINL
jgi:hypothetical protein